MHALRSCPHAEELWQTLKFSWDRGNGINSQGADWIVTQFETLEQKHPGLRDRLLDEKGVRRFINIYVGEEDVRFLEGLKTPVKAGDSISIVPAIAGGR